MKSMKYDFRNTSESTALKLSVIFDANLSFCSCRKIQNPKRELPGFASNTSVHCIETYSNMDEQKVVATIRNIEIIEQKNCITTIRYSIEIS